MVRLVFLIHLENHASGNKRGDIGALVGVDPRLADDDVFAGNLAFRYRIPKRHPECVDVSSARLVASIAYVKADFIDVVGVGINPFQPLADE